MSRRWGVKPLVPFLFRIPHPSRLRVVRSVLLFYSEKLPSPLFFCCAFPLHLLTFPGEPTVWFFPFKTHPSLVSPAFFFCPSGICFFGFSFPVLTDFFLHPHPNPPTLALLAVQATELQLSSPPLSNGVGFPPKSQHFPFFFPSHAFLLWYFFLFRGRPLLSPGLVIHPPIPVAGGDLPSFPPFLFSPFFSFPPHWTLGRTGPSLTPHHSFRAPLKKFSSHPIIQPSLTYLNSTLV